MRLFSNVFNYRRNILWFHVSPLSQMEELGPGTTLSDYFPRRSNFNQKLGTRRMKQIRDNWLGYLVLLSSALVAWY